MKLLYLTQEIYKILDINWVWPFWFAKKPGRTQKKEDANWSSSVFK